MGRHVDHAELVAHQEHREVARAGQAREDLGVARVGQAGRRERFLVDRRGDDSVDRAGLREVHSRLDVRVRRASGGGAHPPAGHGRHVHVGEVEDLEGPGLPAAVRDACDAVQAERRADERGRLRQRRRSADDDGPARALNLGLGSRAHDDLRPHARGVAHRHAEDRVLHAASFWSETNRAGGPKPPALVSTGSTGWPGARM